MKEKILLALLISGFNSSFGQRVSNTETSDCSNIYCAALTIFLEKKEKNCNQILIEKDNLITEKLPSEINSCRILYVDREDIEKELNAKKEITVIHIIPLRVNDGEFFINIIPFTVRKEQGNLTYVNSGGSKISFKFDNVSNEFIFKRLE